LESRGICYLWRLLLISNASVGLLYLNLKLQTIILIGLSSWPWYGTIPIPWFLAEKCVIYIYNTSFPKSFGIFWTPDCPMGTTRKMANANLLIQPFPAGWLLFRNINNSFRTNESKWNKNFDVRLVQYPFVWSCSLSEAIVPILSQKCKYPKFPFKFRWNNFWFFASDLIYLIARGQLIFPAKMGQLIFSLTFSKWVGSSQNFSNYRIKKGIYFLWQNFTSF
jgi:hypothetical protein